MNSLFTVLVSILGIIIIAPALFYFVPAMAGILTQNSDVEVCRLSVIAQASTNAYGSSPVNFKCPRRTVEFFENKVEINDKKSSTFSFSTIADTDVNKVIAEELRTCWYKMGEGKIDAFRRNRATGSESACLVCAEVSFDPRVDQTFNGLETYLRNTKIPKTDTLYFDYLTLSQGMAYTVLGITYLPWITFDVTSNEVTDKPVESKKDYVIYFRAFKPDLVDETLFTDDVFYVGINTPDFLTNPDHCNRLVN